MGSYHSSKLMAHPDIDLVALVDPLSQMDTPVKLLREHKELASLDLDLVFVASPTETHYDVLKDSLSLGRHVFVEKPAASSAEQCRELVALAEKHGLKLAVGHVERWNPVVESLKGLLSEGFLSTPLFVTTKRAGAYPSSVKPGNDVL